MNSRTCTPRIGAWLTASALSHPDDIAGSISDAGITVANIVINDHSTDRGPTRFRTRKPHKIIALATACKNVGMTVDITTWVMPHAKFIEDMGTTVTQLASACGARRVCLDAEEPWTKAEGKDLSYDEAAEAAMASIPGFSLMLSAIVFANDAVAPLARRCKYWSPQAYATTRPKSMTPDKAVKTGVAVWRKKFGNRPISDFIVGLAAYSQPTPPDKYMATCLDQAAAMGVPEVCYWSHGDTVAKFLQQRTGR